MEKKKIEERLEENEDKYKVNTTCEQCYCVSFLAVISSCYAKRVKYKLCMNLSFRFIKVM